MYYIYTYLSYRFKNLLILEHITPRSHEEKTQILLRFVWTYAIEQKYIFTQIVLTMYVILVCGFYEICWI